MIYTIIFDATGTAVGHSSYTFPGGDAPQGWKPPAGEQKVDQEQYDAFANYQLVSGKVVELADDAKVALEQAAARETIAETRYGFEVAGVYWGGFFIATDRDSQNKLLQERSAIATGLRADPSGWKCLDVATGLVELRPTTNAEMQAISAQAYTYVAACFAREGELLEAVKAGTYTDSQLAEGWPDNGNTTNTETTQ